MAKKKACILFSGGKDSSLALFKARERYDIECLLCIYPKNADSFMFHKPNLDLLEKQADMLGIELIVKESEGEKERELKDLEELLNLIKDRIGAAVVGGIASSYQGNRIRRICDELGLKFYAPLWDYTPEKIWEELLKNKFKVILTKISCEGLDKDFLGKIIDERKLEELGKLSKKYKFRLDFEGGEAETAVLYMPGFRKELKVEGNIKSEGKYRHWLEIKKVS